MKYFVDKLEALQDYLNPITYNDLRKSFKTKTFWFNIFIILVLYIIAFCFLLLKPTTLVSDFQTNCLGFLAFLFLVPYILIALEIRSLTINEFKNDNLSFVFLTDITASKFVKGKLLLAGLYNIILLMAAIPFYIFIGYKTDIGFIILIRFFIFGFIVTIPCILVNIIEACKDSKSGKASLLIFETTNCLNLLVSGFLFISYGVNRFASIAEANKESPVRIFLIDLVIASIILLISLFLYLYACSNITKDYPMAEDRDFLPSESRKRKAFEYKSKTDESQKSINQDNFKNKN